MLQLNLVPRVFPLKVGGAPSHLQGKSPGNEVGCSFEKCKCHIIPLPLVTKGTFFCPEKPQAKVAKRMDCTHVYRLSHKNVRDNVERYYGNSGFEAKAVSS